jgi:hypothetical protein
MANEEQAPTHQGERSEAVRTERGEWLKFGGDISAST